MRFPIHRCCYLPAALLAVAVASYAAEAPEQAATEPQGRIETSAAYLSGLDAFSVRIDMELKLVDTAGASDGVLLKGTLALAGADKARFRVEAPDDTMELYANGDATYLYVVGQNQYIDGAILGARKQALTAMPSGAFRGAQMILSDFLHNDPAFHKSFDTAQVERRDTAPLPGAEQFHLDGNGIACDFWIAAGPNPSLMKFSLDLSELASRGTQKYQSASVDYTFTDWNVNPGFPEGYFAFDIPEGATKLENPDQSSPADSLVGKPAPNINLPLLSGETLDLAALKGKNVVILDFWATWCGPCRIGLPIVSRVAERYREKGVLLYAVNIGEDARTVQGFLEQTGITAAIALDEKRVAQQAYSATSIPKTVIVDENGIVREVHEGVSPTLEQDLDALLKKLTE